MRIYSVTITPRDTSRRPAVQCGCTCGLSVKRRNKRAGQTWQTNHLHEHRQA